MTTINDAILAATGGPTINDGLLTHYQAGGATSNDLQDAECEYLLAAGAMLGHMHDMWFERLGNEGYTGSLDDRRHAFWLAGGQWGGVQTLISDTFTGTDGTQLSSHTPEVSPGGVNWSDFSTGGGAGVAASNTIQNNFAECTQDNVGVVIDSGESDVDITLSHRSPGNARGFIVIRHSGPNSAGNGIGLWLRRFDAHFRLMRWDTGNISEYETASVPYVNWTWYDVRVVAEGPRVRVWWDGNLEMDNNTVTHHQTLTWQGFTCGQNSYNFDDFVVVAA